MNAIFQRTSVRIYQAKEVEDAKVEMILRAAMAAPSAGNQQPWEFYVVRNKELLKKLSKCSPYAGCTANATIAIVPCYRKEVMFPENAEMDLSAAVENMLLEIEEQGLGGVWLGVAPLEDRMDAVREVLAIPEELEPFAIVPFGYPVREAKQQDRYDVARVHNC